MGRTEKKIENYLNKLREEHPYEFDTLIAPTTQEYLRNKFTRSMVINSKWYGGNDLELKQLYEKDLKAFRIANVTSDELNYFWAQPTTGLNVRKVHSGLPQLISEKFVDLIISNGYDITLYKDVDFSERDEDNEERLFNILDDNSFDLLLQEGIETESWAGGVAFKLSFDKSQFKYPILECIQPEEYEPTIKAGRIVEDIFITYYNRNGSLYKLKEKYGVNDIGGYIKYSLEKRSGEVWYETKLSDIEETKDLKDISFRGIFEKFSIYKPNKLPNSEFRSSRLGESDYSGSHGLFDALDEVISTMIQEFRDGKIKNFWPSNLLPVDPVTKTTYMPPALKKDFITYQSGIGEKQQAEEPKMVQGDIHSEKYIETYKKLIEAILNNAGLSPQTVGVTGLESTSASEESQELREKTSIRTRQRKIALWIKTLNKLFELMLILDDYMNDSKIGEYIVNVNFSDYKIQTIKDKTNIANSGIMNKTWDIKTAVNYIHESLTDDEKVLMAVNIKIENGINTFTKEEELIYRKFVQDTIEEQGEEPKEEIEPELDDNAEDNTVVEEEVVEA